MLLTDPNVVLVILLVGLWASVLAVYVPGTGLWEVLALAVLAGALYLLLSLPTNWTAVLALVAGTLDFLIMPLYRQRLTALAGAGLLLQIVGSLFLFNGLSASWMTIAATTGISLAFYRFVLIPAQMTRVHPPALSDEQLLPGSVGKVIMPLNPIGTVNVHGELWTAYSDRPLQAGDDVIVIQKEGLRLQVEKVKNKRKPQEDSGG
jgi:membrane-bound serine protease (ClpP class)